MGWDYFVEFEPNIDEAIPRDRQNDLKKVLVQVKATDMPPRAVQDTLSAFKLLVDSDLPAFIVRIEYSDQSSPCRAWLLHIGPTQIAAVLRKVRQTEKAGRVDLHKVHMVLRLDEAVEIELGGENLRRLIAEASPGSNAEYVAAKAEFRKACGFDEHSINACFTFSPGVGEEALVDLMIGKVPYLPITEMVVQKARFGIVLDKDIDRLGEGRLSVEVKPLKQGKLIAVSRDRSRRVEMKVSVFVPAIPELPKNCKRLRCTNDFIDLVLPFGGGTGNLKLDIDPNKRFATDVLSNALAFWTMLAEDGATLELDFGPKRITFPVLQLAKRLRPRDLLHELIQTLAISLFRLHRVNDVEVTIYEMEQALDENRDRFALLARSGFEITIRSSEDIPSSFLASGAIFVPTYIEFGSLVYFATVSMQAKEIMKNDDGSIRFVGGHPRVVEDGVVDRFEFQLTTLNQRTAELGRTESGKGLSIITMQATRS